MVPEVKELNIEERAPTGRENTMVRPCSETHKKHALATHSHLFNTKPVRAHNRLSTEFEQAF